ncbi:MAG TPA: helix-turn-helix transcriptional regulator [Gaiellaceae bacterium]|nr:helix-turn-helix transcriptional regulator [Gaiellaceae bacterium]
MRRPLNERDFWLVDSLGVPSTIHDLSGRFVHMNAAAEQASGFTNAQLRGHELTDRLPAESRDAVLAVFRRAVEQGEPTDFETIFVDGSGETRGARVQQLPLRDGDEIIGVLSLAFGVRAVHSGSIGLQPLPQLTARQHEVLELIAAGHSTSEIARGLTLSTETIRNHLRNLFKALNAHSRIEAIAAAQRLGLLASPGLGPQVDDD